MKNKLARVAMVLFITIFVGCPWNRTVTPIPPVVTDQDMCAAACENLQRLHCPEGDPIDMGKACLLDVECQASHCLKGRCTATCEQFCRDTENAGVWLNPTFAKTITRCDQLR